MTDFPAKVGMAAKEILMKIGKKTTNKGGDNLSRFAGWEVLPPLSGDDWHSAKNRMKRALK